MFDYIFPRQSLFPVGQLYRFIDDVFGDIGTRDAGHQHAKPRLEYRDIGSGYEVRLEIPGLTSKDVEIEVTDDTLTLRGKEKELDLEGYRTHRSERRRLNFNQSYSFPERIDDEKVQAELDNGILTVTLAKKASAEARTIAIKAS